MFWHVNRYFKVKNFSNVQSLHGFLFRNKNANEFYLDMYLFKIFLHVLVKGNMIDWRLIVKIYSRYKADRVAYTPV